MIKMLFILNELRPSIQIKRIAQRINMLNEGNKQRRKAEKLLFENPKPIYMGILSHEESKDFKPHFLIVVEKQGHFAMGKVTYELFSEQCMKYFGGGKTFKTWLGENGMSIRELESGFYKITKNKK